MKKQAHIKGSFEDLKPSLESLKSLLETTEELPKKQNVEELMEKDLKNIRDKGISNNS